MCQHNCDEGGICLAELSGYMESCPNKAIEPINFDALGIVLAQYPDSTPITEAEELRGLSVGGLTVLAARAASFTTLLETLQWVRSNYAGGSTKEINARIDAALGVAA